MRNILGLDLGTNSIGWAVTQLDFDKKEGEIKGLGSRIIPMDQDEIKGFSRGITKSATATRTEKRGVRRLYQRDNLRRDRLHRVLNILDFLPEHYKSAIHWENGKDKGKGQFFDDSEIKLPYKPIPKINDFERQRYEFIFKEAFEEMLTDFKKYQPELFYKKGNGQETKVPYDWTIYYLRKKALEKQITDYELAWLILHFNTKRGYYQQRDDEEFEQEDKKVRKEYITAVFKNIEDTEKNDKYGNMVLKAVITCDLGEFHPKMFKKEIPDWIGKEKDLILTINIDKNKKDKLNDEGNVDCRISVPKEDDYNLLKAKAERTIDNSNTTVGAYIYDTLLKNPNQKIRGKLIRTIGRKYYKEELEKIIDKQVSLNPKLKDLDLYQKCIKELYPINETRQKVLNSIKDENKFKFLFIKDIIFYHRPLKSKKSLITNCKYEYRTILTDRADFETFFNKIKGNKDLTEDDKIEKINPSEICFVKDIKVIQANSKKGKRNVKVTKKEDVTYKYINYKKSDRFIKHIKEAKNYKELITKIEGNNIYLTKYIKNPIKAVVKSNPYYQEFRIWQFIQNLKILEKKKQVNGKLVIDADVTNEFIKNENDRAELFEKFNEMASIKQSQFLKIFKNSNNKSLTSKTHKWNYDEDNEYPLNRTRHALTVKFRDNKKFLDFYRQNEYRLWHLFYSISGIDELKKALKKLYNKNKNYLPDDFVKKAMKIKPFKKEYGAYSEKALKKILPLMRIGQFSDEKHIEQQYKETIDKIYERLESKNVFNSKLAEEKKTEIINKLADDEITKGMLNSFADCPQKKYTGLQVHQTSYAVYGNHSEAQDVKKWNNPKDIQNYLLYEFKQYSLRNPIVEKVVTETLRVVSDIWEQFGNNEPDFFDEIHIELGRDLQNTKKEKERITKIVSNNTKTNTRIRNILREFKENKNINIKDVRPDSPYQQTKFKIFEDDILIRYSQKELENEKQDGVKIHKVVASSEPTKEEIEKYKLWLEQKYQSPYTGEIIRLSELFTENYQVEHILPQSRITNNSLNNKIICEAVINPAPYKDNQTGYEFIINNENREVKELSTKKTAVKIFSKSAYEDFVNNNYKENPKKQKILLSEEIPDGFINRQGNDSRYIAREMSKLLSKIVREEGENEINSKNILIVSGGVTDILKHDWGLNHIWNEIVLPRFERLNKLTGTENFTYINKNGKKVATVPKELVNDFKVKRIDHRHHAMDAVIIACATRNHVNLINNKHAKKGNQRYDLRKKIQFKKPTDKKDKYKWTYKKPWDNFTKETKDNLEKVIISFKQNLRIITKATNKYQKWEKQENGKYRKVFVEQKGNFVAIRKQLHEDTYYGKKIINNEEYTSVRKQLNAELFKNGTKKTSSEVIKSSVKDQSLKNILLNHLKKYNTAEISIFDALKEKQNDVFRDDELRNKIKKLKTDKKNIEEYFNENPINEGKKNDNKVEVFINRVNYIFNNEKITENPDIAFSQEGIEKMNKNIVELNNGKKHKPIYNVRVYSVFGNKFEVGTKTNKDKKYVATAGDSNLFFNIYKKNDKRYFEVISLEESINHQKERRKLNNEERKRTQMFPIKEKKEYLFTLSPNDLVYVPTNKEIKNHSLVDFSNLTEEQYSRIYKFRDANKSKNGYISNFIPHNISTVIFKQTKDLKIMLANGKELKNEIPLTNTNDKHQRSISEEIGTKFDKKTKKDKIIIKDEVMIRDFCWKLKVNRLGKIVEVNTGDKIIKLV